MSAEPAAEDWAVSQEAEQSLLGALLLDSTAYDQVVHTVAAGDFYSLDHGHIFRAVVALRGRGQVADVVTTAEHMGRASPEALARAGGLAYLAALAQNTPSALNILRYADLVRERSLCRKLYAIGADILQEVRGRRDRTAADLIQYARTRIGTLFDNAHPGRQIRADSAAELLNADLPELEPLLTPWLFEKNLVLVHSRRGVGKTHFGLACAFAIAAGAKFLEWSAPRPRGVLFIDGEMPAQLMQRRLRELASGHGEVPSALRIVTPDRQSRPMPDLATAAGQAEIDALVTEDTALLIIDNLSCLVRSGGAENESESWGAVAEWALKHRRAGRAIMFVHHSGKTGVQRGTSKREDLLDVVINLRRPQEYTEADGAVFVVNFEKARSLTGDDIAPIEAKLEQLPGGGQAWTCRPAATALQDQIKALWDGGTLTLTDVYREVECNKSHAHRTLTAAMQKGELKRAYPQKQRGGSHATNTRN